MACFVSDGFQEALEVSMTALKLGSLVLKEEQKAALYAVTLKKKDCLCILPTGFGKSLIFQLVPFVVDRLEKVNHSCVLVVSPLNVIISDQIEKLKERGVGVKVLKEDDKFVNQSIDDTVKFVYGHAEAFVENQSVRTLLRSSFRNRVKAVVIDEAHFIVQW